MKRPAMRRRPGGWFLVAAGLALVAALATLRAAAANVPMDQIVVAREALAVGSRLTPASRDVVMRTVPRDGVLPGMLRSLDEIDGLVLAVPVEAGEPVTLATVGGRPGGSAGPLAVGERAVSIPIAAAGAAAAILVPGVRVDVVASPTVPGEEARVVVANAEVLGQSRSTGSDGGGLDGGAVLVRVLERDALRLSTALDSAGTVRLLPRPAVDSASEDAP